MANDSDRSAREAASHLVDALIATGANQGAQITQDLAAKIRRNIRKDMDALAILAVVRRILDEGVPLLGRALQDAIVASWLAGGEGVAKRVPKAKLPFDAREPPIPPVQRLLFPDEPEPEITFPIIEEAASNLAARRVMTAAEYYRASEAARARAFTISGDLAQETIAKVQEYLTEDIERGGTLREFEEFMREETPLSPARIETVYRTNVGMAYARGQEKVLDNWIVKSAFPYVLNASIQDSRTTELCRRIATSGIGGSAVFRLDDPAWQHFRPLRHWNCFLPGTLVQGRFNVALRSWYSGDVVEMRTRRGHRLCITGNHPILTSHGFAAANTLEKGEKVLSYGAWRKNRLDAHGRFEAPINSPRKNDANFFHPNVYVNDSPTPIEQVFHAFTKMGKIERTPSGADDFYGDGAFGDGYVEVVRANSHLLIDDDFPRAAALPFHSLSASFQDRPFGELRFGLASQLNSSEIQPLCEREARDAKFVAEPIERLASAVAPLQRLNVNIQTVFPNLARTERHSLLVSPELHSCSTKGTRKSEGTDAYLLGQFVQRLTGSVTANELLQVLDVDTATQKNGLLHTSKLDARNHEMPLEDASGSADFACQLLETFPSLVTVDEIVEIRNFDWCGHVYDLQSPSGWIVANNIFTSNCRCDAVPLTVADAAKRGVPEAMAWLQSGVEPSNPSWVPWPDVELPPGWVPGGGE